MKAERVLAHYERTADTPEAIPRLRRFVLDLAVRGKLVEQDPNDESVSDLLQEIAAGKLRLVRAGSIRNPRDLGGDEDILPPFEIPTCWRWVRLDRVGAIVGGGTPSATDADNFAESGTAVPWLTPADLGNFSNLFISHGTRDLSETGLQNSSATLMPAGTVLFTSRAPIGYVAISTNPISTNQGFKSIVPYVPGCARFIALSMKAFAPKVNANASGTTFKEVSGKIVAGIPFPLPPLAEQYRIVAKVDALMALCDQLEAARTHRETTRNRMAAASLARLNAPDADLDTFQGHTTFALENLTGLTTRPDQIKALRQTILNLAIRGKLVAQDPNDEPASDLVKRIAADQEKLDSRTTFKRSKPLPPINTSDAPFLLPSGWVWVRFPEVGMFGRGKSKHRPRNDPILYTNGTYPFIQTGDVARSQGSIRAYSSRYNDAGLAQSALWPEGTLCITIAANIADSGILTFDACFPDSVVGLVAHDCFKSARFFEYFMRTAKNDLQEFAPSTAQKNINLGTLTEVLVPLPPLAELDRIVAKVDELLALCDRLEESLNTGIDTRRRLLDAVLHGALTPNAESGAAA